jgi:hypothetical protein
VIGVVLLFAQRESCRSTAATAAIMGGVSLRLSPKQVQAIAGFICGGDDPWPYRRMVDISSFVRFTGVEVPHEIEVGSRFVSACAFVEEAEDDKQQGHSGLARDTEKVLEALLDRREFDTDEQHRSAIESVQDTMAGLPLEVVADDTGQIEIRSTRRDRARRVLDEQIHTAFGDVLSGEDLASARRHYGKAKRFLETREPDYENSCKESVCTIESLATTLTGEKDLPTAVKKAARAKLIPRPLDDMIIKIYAYRGNEPGVGHGHAAAPAVRRAEAELLFDLAAALGRYLRVALTAEQPVLPEVATGFRPN